MSRPLFKPTLAIIDDSNKIFKNLKTRCRYVSWRKLNEAKFLNQMSDEESR